MPETQGSIKRAPASGTARLPETQERYKSGAQNLFHISGVKATQTDPEFVVGTPDMTITNTNQDQISVPSEYVDATGIEFGDMIPEFKYEDVPASESALGQDSGYIKALSIVEDLRLKSIGVLEFTDVDKNRLNFYNQYLTAANIANDDKIRQEQAQAEAVALKLVDEALALLSSVSNENAATDADFIVAEVEVIIRKLGSVVSNKISAKLAEIKQKIQAKTAKLEGK